ncbi:MAG: 1,2-phenylacetyl-CoA epoxidase subunit PaaD [Myxococcota bacterium]
MVKPLATVLDMELERARRVAELVPDPELPMVTIGELGMVRGVHRTQEGLRVELTPTYSGCPATEFIHQNVEQALTEAGISAAAVFVRSPAWTTDWITDEGRRKLRAAGIAPPVRAAGDNLPVLQLFEERVVPCPLCDSTETERISEHGSTPCKALYRCTACKEPFDHFKCH